MHILNVIHLNAAEFFSATANVGAGVLRSNDNAAWACRVQSADEWNALCSCTRRAALETQWRDTGERCEASLAWALNDVFGDVSWIVGAFKICAQVIGDTGQFYHYKICKGEGGGMRDTRGPPAFGLISVVLLPSVSQHQLFHRSMVTGVAAHAAYIYCCVLSMLYVIVDSMDCPASSHHLPPYPANPAGPSAPAGFSLFVFIVPIQERIMARQFNTSGKSMKFTDLGARILLEVLRIYDIRANEVRGIRNIQHVHSANIAVAFSLPILASTLVFVAYARATSGFNIRSLSKIADAWNALSRFKAVFNAQTLNEAPFKIDPAQDGKKAMVPEKEKVEVVETGGEPEEERPFQVQNVTMRIPLGTLAGVGLIGEMRRIGGELSFGGGVAYYAQMTWIRNATARENVLFGKPFESDRYWRIMEGFQVSIYSYREVKKQHVNIARAVYYDADIALFQNAMLAPLVRATTYTLDGGRVAEQGTYQELITRGGEFSRLDKEFGGTAVEEPTENLVTVTVTVEDLKAKSAEAAGTGKIVERVYTSYIKAAHGRYILACVIVAVLGMQGFQISNCYTPVWWQAK
ncbi:hypothetical protein B0H13DRAFT_2363720 [Mycena leptocephala]|nr:hypothetical protein B0H13DRAFT_2363720 [Mycena leptocephala]